MTDSILHVASYTNARVEINAICAKYDIVLTCNSVAVIKDPFGDHLLIMTVVFLFIRPSSFF